MKILRRELVVSVAFMVVVEEEVVRVVGMVLESKS